MRGRSYTPSPPRGSYGRRGRRSPSPRGGRYGGARSVDLPTSLLVRNLRHDCRQEDLRRSFEQFGPLKDIYMPRDYYTGMHCCLTCFMCVDPRGFGFVQFVDPADAAEAKYQMDGYHLLGRELTVVFAEENRKQPTEMRARERGGGRSIRSRDRRRSPPRYYSRSPPPRRGRSRSGSDDYYSPPSRRHHSRSISPGEERYARGRSYSRSSAYNGSRGRSVTPARSKRRSISRSPSPGISISPSPRRNVSRSPSPRRSRSNTPVPARGCSPRRKRRSNTPIPTRSSPKRKRSNTPIPARSRSPKRKRSNTPIPARNRSQREEEYEDRSPSQ
uniref:RRM domain-containing protein n=1 Tax=Brassica campestris TaxID=3711 RepID=A0A3P5Z5C2_BRACM|nr:unnamed protein product [Brassica rapa]